MTNGGGMAVGRGFVMVSIGGGLLDDVRVIDPEMMLGKGLAGQMPVL